MKPSTAIVTSTIGRNTLQKTMLSVAEQTRNCVHYVIVNGKEYEDAAMEIIKDFPKCISIRNGISMGYSHDGRQLGASGNYAASCYLVKEDIVMYVDDDNWLEADHVDTMTALMHENELEWAYSLRKICDRNGVFLCEDNCESLGKWGAYTGGYHLVDQNCLALRRAVGQLIAPAWMKSDFLADRIVTNTLMSNFRRYGTTGYSTVNYRLGGGGNKVTKHFFETGNQYYQELYKGQLPWRQKCAFE